METKDLIYAFLLTRLDTYFSNDYDEVEDYRIIYDKLEISYRGKLNGIRNTENFDLLEYLTFIYNYKQK